MKRTCRRCWRVTELVAFPGPVWVLPAHTPPGAAYPFLCAGSHTTDYRPVRS